MINIFFRQKCGQYWNCEEVLCLDKRGHKIITSMNNIQMCGLVTSLSRFYAYYVVAGQLNPRVEREFTKLCVSDHKSVSLESPHHCPSRCLERRIPGARTDTGPPSYSLFIGLRPLTTQPYKYTPWGFFVYHGHSLCNFFIIVMFT